MARPLGPADRVPYGFGRGYTPPDAPVESYLALLDRLSCAHGLVVQGNAHGYDNRVQLFCDHRVMQDMAPTLRAMSREMPVIIDHMLMVPATKSVNEPNFQSLLKLVGEEHVHVKVSAAYRLSDRFPDYPDAKPFHDALLAANPERLVWVPTGRIPGLPPKPCRTRVICSTCSIPGHLMSRLVIAFLSIRRRGCLVVNRTPFLPSGRPFFTAESPRK